MRLTFLSKTLIAMSLIAVLPTAVATGVQRTAQAQSEAILLMPQFAYGENGRAE
jgi:hypothetical protein